MKARVAHSLLATLDRECAAYCVLSGYDTLPDHFDTDIDFMVGRADWERVPRMIAAIARETDTVLIQSVDHETSGSAFWLASLTESGLATAQLDAASDYRHFGALWLRSEEVLAKRRWRPRGFWTASAAHEFAYYLIKRLNKRDFAPVHGSRLHRLYADDRSGCESMLARFWSGPRFNALRRMAAENNWMELVGSIDTYRQEMLRHRPESVAVRIAGAAGRGSHLFNRMARPTGVWMAFVGPDGCGKSTVIPAVNAQIAPVFRSVLRFHMRPAVLGGGASRRLPVTDPHGRPPRGLAASIAKVLYFAADYWLGYWLRIAPAAIRTRLIVFDRYVYDLLVDSKRVRYGGPPWLLRALVRAVPRPDLTILLDAPAEVLWSRKQEVSFEEVVRQRQSFLAMAAQQNIVVVNAAQPIRCVVHDVECAILRYLAQRAAHRLGLQASDVQVRSAL